MSRLRGMLGRARPLLERRVLAVMLLICGLGYGFAQLADEMREGETTSFDTAVLLAFRSPADPADPLGPGWMEELGRDVTALGSVGVLAGLTFGAAGYLWLAGRRGTMLLVLLSVFGGQAASSIFKLVFDRARPDLVPHGTATYTASFPSGHAMMAAVTYLTLAALLARIQPRRALAAYLLSLGVVLTLAVGVSRVYLGVHWPTDVLAGWSAGAAWALACLLVANRINGRARRE